MTYLLFGGQKALCCCCWCGTRAESNEQFYSSEKSASAGRWRSPSCKLGKQERWRPSRWRLKPNVKLTIRGYRPPRFGGDIDTFEDKFLVPYREYDQQIRVENEDGGDRVLARRQELKKSATQMMDADEIYDGKPWIDLSEQELRKGFENFAGVDVQQKSDVVFCRQISRVLKMDASVPVDSRVFMKKRALRKYLADSGLTDVVKPGDR